MRKVLLAATALAFPATAYAVPITTGSEINVTGSGTFTTSVINFVNPADIPVGGTTGSFAVLGSCTGCATMTTPFTYSPFTPGELYTVSNNGVTATFTAQTQTSITNDFPTDITIHDTGVFSLTGFSNTKGTLVLTLNQGVVTGSFSSTGLVTGGGGGSVPEPMSLALLGTGLVGLGLVRRMRSS